MKGDFSRLTFDPNNNFSRVLMQMGRVQLDSDWNEQGDILLHFMRTLARDLIGPHGGPGEGFTLTRDAVGDGTFDLLITPGRYYVGGHLCVCPERFNGSEVSYFNQPYYRPPGESKTFSSSLKETMAYLDVWERHITGFEDNSLFEIALDGVDTTTRTQVVWQLKLLELTGDENGLLAKERAAGIERSRLCFTMFSGTRSSAQLRARSAPAEHNDDPCNIESDALYRGAENQLYRVEIHQGNVRTDRNDFDDSKKPTFKWSRENGSIVFPVTGVASVKGGGKKTRVTLANLGRDEKLSLREGDVVELVDDDYTLSNSAGDLLKVLSVERDEFAVVLEGAPGIQFDDTRHPLLRRWDQKAAGLFQTGIEISLNGVSDNDWLTLEDGVQIQFRPSDVEGPRMLFHTGDYWLIPARTNTRDIVWPKDAAGNAEARPPRGIKHYYAPLGIVSQGGEIQKCRCTINPLTDCGRTTTEIHKEEKTKPVETTVKQATKQKQTKKGK